MAASRIHLQTLFLAGKSFTPINLLEKNLATSSLSITDLMRENLNKMSDSDDVSCLECLVQEMKLTRTRSVEKIIISFHKFNVANILKLMVKLLKDGIVSAKDLEIAFRMCNSFFDEDDYALLSSQSLATQKI